MALTDRGRWSSSLTTEFGEAVAGSITEKGQSLFGSVPPGVFISLVAAGTSAVVILATKTLIDQPGHRASAQEPEHRLAEVQGDHRTSAPEGGHSLAAIEFAHSGAGPEAR